jgi:uncharacterized membrane protein
MTEQVMQDLSKPGRQSKKFLMACLALGLNVLVLGIALFVFAQVYAEKPETADWFGFGGMLAMALAAMNTMPLGYVGGTAWQEKAVRVAAIGKGLKEEEDARAAK